MCCFKDYYWNYYSLAFLYFGYVILCEGFDIYYIETHKYLYSESQYIIMIIVTVMLSVMSPLSVMPSNRYGNNGCFGDLLDYYDNNYISAVITSLIQYLLKITSAVVIMLNQYDIINLFNKESKHIQPINTLFTMSFYIGILTCIVFVLLINLLTGISNYCDKICICLTCNYKNRYKNNIELF